MSDPDESPLKFPCDFPIKAMGKTSANLESMVVTIIRKHVNDLGKGAIRERLSSGGKYTSVTVTIRATSRAQLDAIYQDLSDCDDVLMAF